MMQKKIFLASFTNGQAHLVKVTVEQDCPKTLAIGPEREFLIGGRIWLGRRIHKFPVHKTKVMPIKRFDSGEEALAWLVGRAEKYEGQMRLQLADAQEQVEMLKGRQIAIVAGGPPERLK